MARRDDDQTRLVTNIIKSFIESWIDWAEKWSTPNVDGRGCHDHRALSTWTLVADGDIQLRRQAWEIEKCHAELACSFKFDELLEEVTPGKKPVVQHRQGMGRTLFD